MADVHPTSHGGDCGGDPPDGGGWQGQSGCQSIGAKQGRGRSRNKGLKAAVSKSQSSSVLPIDFEQNDKGTYIAVGPYSDQFNSLVGTIISKIPYYYPAWKQVPEEHRTTIIPEIQTFFDVNSHFNGPQGNKIKVEIDKYCSRLYKDQKFKFGKTWFDKRGGIEHVDELRDSPPGDMPLDEWHKFVKFKTGVKFQARSSANKACRSKHTIVVRHGRKNLAQMRYEHRDPVSQEPPSPIAEYARLQMRNGQFTEAQAAENYRRMIDMKNAQASSQNPMTDDQILEEVLGSRRGWTRGIGQKLPQYAYTSSSSMTSQGTYTQDEVNQMMANMMSQMDARTAPLYKALGKAGIMIPSDEDEGDEEEEDDGESSD